MSVTVRAIRDRVIEKLQDFNRTSPVFTIPQIDLEMKGAYQVLAAKMPFPHVYSTNLLTIAANTDTFTLPTNLGSDIRIRLQSIGRFLYKVDAEELDSFRNLQFQFPQAASIPLYFTLWNEPGALGTDLHGRVWPPAKQAEVCDVYYSRIPPELVGPTLESQDILFDIDAAEALINKVSADLLDRLTPDDAAKLKLNPQIARKWDKDSELMVYRAAVTRHNIEDSGRTQRWVP